MSNVTLKPLLLIPVENQVRELDPKLLLACIAARRGFSSVIGSRQQLDFRIASFPRGIYLSKSMTVRSIRMFKILRNLGHEIVAWDEEALVHLPPETYFSRRLSPKAMGYLSHLFAWGQDNVDLWQQYPQLPIQVPIHISGNPRNDMLRSEMHGFFKNNIAKLRHAYGDFILVNTNFNHVNAFYPVQGLFLPLKKHGDKPKFGRSARGMTRKFAEGFRDHKLAIFEDFKALIPCLERAFPNHMIVVRPHPTERHDIYHEIASQCERVRVTNEGNVIPWLMAAKALIHNGCTTGVEAYVMRVPTISYRATVNDYYDYGFYQLPNRLSHECLNFEQLRATLMKILAGEIGAVDGNESKVLIDHHLAAINGPMACERIVDIIEKIRAARSRLPEPSLINRMNGWSVATLRRLVKRLLSYLPDSHNRTEFHRHRYPGTSLDEVRGRVSRIKKALGDSSVSQVDQISSEIFQISPQARGRNTSFQVGHTH
ncbi:surface carbohydrate biosynthesis protein [Thermodesulfobacteriota bacterium]